MIKSASIHDLELFFLPDSDSGMKLVNELFPGAVKKKFSGKGSAYKWIINEGGTIVAEMWRTKTGEYHLLIKKDKTPDERLSDVNSLFTGRRFAVRSDQKSPAKEP